MFCALVAVISKRNIYLHHHQKALAWKPHFCIWNWIHGFAKTHTKNARQTFPLPFCAHNASYRNVTQLYQLQLRLHFLSHRTPGSTLRLIKHSASAKVCCCGSRQTNEPVDSTAVINGKFRHYMAPVQTALVRNTSGSDRRTCLRVRARSTTKTQALFSCFLLNAANRYRS